MSNSSPIDGIRHSLAHLLAAAVLKKYPGTRLGIGPVIENGFYYDFEFPEGLAPGEGDLKDIETAMKKLIGGKLPFTGREVGAEEAKTLFIEQPFKLDLINEYAGEGRTLTVYKTGDIFEDLCKGGHVGNTSEIPADGFTLTHLAGAYWRGSEKNAQLTRIYGIAFASKEELDAHEKMLAEAKKRDHKILGPALDLFAFSELVGSGLPLWTPRGTILRNLLDNFVWELRAKRGYMRVEIPHITKKELYEKSGHWDKYKDDLFRITTREGHEFAMKPMNCPHHTQIYARRPWSYRELPQRYANSTMVYRDEQSGELAGLSRVLSITQDDAHVFCRMTQVQEEAIKIWDIIHEFYGVFNIPLRVRLSLRDPKHPEKYLGDGARWEAAEETLRGVVVAKGAHAEDGLGEAAFYGPKLDFMGRDAIGREHQVATIQLDFNQPERFDLTCTNDKGEHERIVMIHAAIMGSIERFLALAIEHFAGAFPIWLAPTQAVVVPVSEKFDDYASSVLTKLQGRGIRAELSPADETLGKRVREAEKMKVPYILVVGEKEETAKAVSVRHSTRGSSSAEASKDKQEGEIKLDAFCKKILAEIAEKAL